MQIFIVRDYMAKYPDLKGKALTDRLIIDLLGENAQILRSAAGKPSISWEKDSEPPFVSVSHTGDIFACVFDRDNVGVDVQIEKKMDFVRVSRRYYTAEEQKYVGSDPGRFFEVWTRKEAFAKYTGLGLAQVTSHEDVLNRNDVIFRDVTIYDGYHMSICTAAGAEEKDYEIHFLD